MHSGSLPSGDKDGHDRSEKYVVKWGGYVIAVYADCGYVRLDVKDDEGGLVTKLLSAEDIAGITIASSFLLPAVLRDVNDALRKALKDAQKG